MPISLDTITPLNQTTPHLSFLERLHRQAISPDDPWSVILDTIKGREGRDRVERISTEMIFELLDVPPFARNARLAERVRGLMVRRGWIPVRSRHPTGKGHAARVRGYARLADDAKVPTSPNDRTV